MKKVKNFTKKVKNLEKVKNFFHFFCEVFYFFCEKLHKKSEEIISLCLKTKHENDKYNIIIFIKLQEESKVDLFKIIIHIFKIKFVCVLRKIS